MNINILQLITLFSGFLLFVLGVIFILNSLQKKLSNKLLGGFLISNAILLTNFFLFITFPEYPVSYPVIQTLGMHSYLLLAPFLFLYISSLCAYEYRLSIKTVFHFLPYTVLVLLVLLIKYFKENIETIIPNIDYAYYLMYKPILYTQICTYVFASFIKLRQYRLQLREQYSSFIKIDLQWINLVLYFLILMCSTDIIIYVWDNMHFSGSAVHDFLTYQTISINLVLCISLIYKGMGQTNIPAGKQPLPKYVQNNADLINYEDYKKQLTDFMMSEKPFLLPELSLDELASKMNITSRLLSQIIHVCFNQNFNNYINQYRIEEAKILFANDKENKKSVYEIQYDAGFNSKSAFNNSFKKNTGLTPKEFRKR